MKILSVDSTATACSAALTDNEKVLGEFYCNTKLTHSQTLMIMIQQLMACTKCSLEDLDGLAVSAGPGSFTGVRIGVSAVKGMAMALEKPCVGVSTLEAMAVNLSNINGVICSLMDARCGQVYTALFRAENGIVTRLTEDKAVSIQQIAQECAAFSVPVYLVGDGAEMCAKQKDFQDLGAILLPESIRYQRASGVAKVALSAFQKGESMDAAELAPVYLRLPQAERELKRKQQS